MLQTVAKATEQLHKWHEQMKQTTTLGEDKE
jgi:hypothetical protein